MATPTPPPATSDQALAESQSYKAMLDEVETIVRDLGKDDFDLDQMVGHIERGFALIKSMRERLQTTKDQVEKLRLENS